MIFKKILFTKICPHPKFKKKFLARNLKSHTFGGYNKINNMCKSKRILKQKACVVCNEIKIISEYSFYQQKCKTCESLQLYKCCKCNNIKHHKDFEKSNSRKSGISSKCKKCLQDYRKLKPRKITITRRSRMFFKDCIKRLNHSKLSNVYVVLGYTKEDFKTKFPYIPTGYDIDHCIPLSWFKESTPISISCSLHNLQLLEHSINIKKNNFYFDKPSNKEYFINSMNFIKEEYLHMF